MSHACPCCGSDLGRRRVGLDPVYALPIVVCGCGHACVRRRHPLIAGWRRARRSILALLALGVQCLVLGVLVGGLASFVLGLEKDLRAMQMSWRGLLLAVDPGAGVRTDQFVPWLRTDGVVWLALMVMAAAGAGVWLRATLGHWRGWRLVAAWWLLLAGVLSVEPVTEWLDAAGMWTQGQTPKYRGPSASIWVDRMWVAGLCVAIGAAASPIGRMIAGLMPAVRARRLGKRRARRRKVRQG